jgi:hypothetical protein
MKTCTGCKGELPLESFLFERRRGRYMARCKACRKMLDAERYKAKFGNGQVPRRKRAKYARSDAPDPLNVVAREWMGPAWAFRWGWEAAA